MEDLTNELKTAKAKLIRLVDSFPREKRELVLFDKWSLKDILSHLSGWAKYQIETLKQIKRGDEVRSPKNLKITINESLVSLRQKWSWDKVYQEFLRLSEELVNEYENLPEKLWKRQIVKSKQPTVEDFIKIEINHYRKTHGPQIKEKISFLT